MIDTLNARRAFFVGKTGRIAKLLVVVGLLCYPATIQADTLSLGHQAGVRTRVSALTLTPTSALTAATLAATAPVAAPNTKSVWVTAYTSDPDETSDHPLITASGGMVRDGVIAANFLPFGTRIMIPSLFGDKIFIVEDRTSEKYSGRVDIWMPTYSQALIFGIQHAEIVILDQDIALQ